VKLWRLRPPLYCMLKSRRLGRRVKSQGIRVGKALVLVHLETLQPTAKATVSLPCPALTVFTRPHIESFLLQFKYTTWPGAYLETGSLHCSHTAEAARVVGSAKLEGVKCPFNCTHDSPATHQPHPPEIKRFPAPLLLPCSISLDLKGSAAETQFVPAASLALGGLGGFLLETALLQLVLDTVHVKVGNVQSFDFSAYFVHEDETGVAAYVLDFEVAGWSLLLGRFLIDELLDERQTIELSARTTLHQDLAVACPGGQD